MFHCQSCLSFSSTSKWDDVILMYMNTSCTCQVTPARFGRGFYESRGMMVPCSSFPVRRTFFKSYCDVDTIDIGNKVMKILAYVVLQVLLFWGCLCFPPCFTWSTFDIICLCWTHGTFSTLYLYLKLKSAALTRKCRHRVLAMSKL